MRYLLWGTWASSNTKHLPTGTSSHLSVETWEASDAGLPQWIWNTHSACWLRLQPALCCWLVLGALGSPRAVVGTNALEQAAGMDGKAAAGRGATGSRHSSSSVHWGECGPQINTPQYPGLSRQQTNSFRLATCGPLSLLSAWWAVRWVFPSARAVCEFCNTCWGLRSPLVTRAQSLSQGRWGFWGDFVHMSGRQH